MTLNAGLPAEVRPLVPLLEYQRADVESAARFSWCCWSRQTGKSFTKSLRRLLRGLLRQRDQILLSAGERQSRELMLKVRQHCQALQIASRAVGGEGLGELRAGSLFLELPGGVRMIGLPANPQTARGFTGDVLLDEFAMHREDREIWAAIFPSVLRGEGELDVASTPKGKDNLFAQLRGNPQFRSSVVTLEDAVAAGLDVDADAIRRSMNDEELYRQEFLCEFLDEGSVFLTYEQIRRIEDPLLDRGFSLAHLKGLAGPLYAGMDIGRHRDLTVIWVLEATEPGVLGDPAATLHDAEGRPGPRQAAGSVLITRGVRESRGEPFREQYTALHELLSLRQVRRCCIDSGGMGSPLAEAAVEEFGASRVEPVVFNAMVKDEMAHRLRMRLEEGTIRIPVDADIRNDWHSVRRSVTAAGPTRFEAVRGGSGHGDRFWAACLAVRAAGVPLGVVEAIRGPALRFTRSGAW